MSRGAEKRRPPGYENGDPFIRRCPGCRRDVRARGLPDREKRVLAATFAVVHREHFEALNPGANVHRCGLCGLELLFDHRCPEMGHVYERRVEWTPELAAAYRDVVDMFAKGGARTVLPWGREEYSRAYNLAKLWGLRADAEAAGGAA